MSVQEKYRTSWGPELYVFITNLGYCQSWSFAWNTMLRCQLRSPDWAGAWAVRADQIWTIWKGLGLLRVMGRNSAQSLRKPKQPLSKTTEKTMPVRNRSKMQTTMTKVHAQFGKKKSATTVGNLGVFIQSDWAERALLKELTHPVQRFICMEPTWGWDHVRIDFSTWLKK